MSRLRPLLAAAALAAAVAPAHAQSEIIDGNDVSTIASIVRGYGSAEVDSQGNGNPLVFGTYQGRTYALLFLNCTNGTDCEDVQFYYVIVGGGASIEDMNDWNAQYRFSRAYLDGDGDPVIEMDINLEYGVTYENFEATLRVWNSLVSEFDSSFG